MSRNIDLDFDLIQHLNEDCDVGLLDTHALQRARLAQGEDWAALLQTQCPHIFAPAAVFVSAAQWLQMREVIAAAEQALNPVPDAAAQGVFYGYDFHLNVEGAHLIEINSNAGGAWLGALLQDSQYDSDLPGIPLTEGNLIEGFLAMFQQEWARERGDAPLRRIAIVDEQPEQQYLYPEFLLAQAAWQRAGIMAQVVAPEDLCAKADGLYCGEEKIDLIYNRLTDFSLQTYPALLQAYHAGQVVLTPHPAAYSRYADKRHLVTLSQSENSALQDGVPATQLVVPEQEAALWEARRDLFFKPLNGYGSKGAYRGDKLTKRVFGEIMHSDYVAQRLAVPGERAVCVGDANVRLKFDVRCYVYQGEVQLVLARMYQGQTTNFRTQGGGFALVRLLD